MKSILVLRGIPGSGKTTWIKENRLEQFVISKDLIRQLIGTVNFMDRDLSLKLDFTRSREENVDSMFFRCIEEKMSRGNFIVIDNCNINPKSINKIYKYSKIFGYKVFIKSFDIPHDVFNRLKGRNTLFNKIPEDTIRGMIKSYLSFNYSQLSNPNDVIVIKELSEISEYWKSKYKEYVISGSMNNHIIGDIHSENSKLSNIVPLMDQDTYIFLGDYCDRGSDPVGTLKSLMSTSKLENSKNIIFLEGNHEVHLRRWANDLPPVSNSFKETTMNKLDSSDIQKSQLREFLNNLKPFIILNVDGSRFICSHAGLPNPKIIDLDYLYMGVGTFISGYRDIDEQDNKFSSISKIMRTGANKLYSIHGHVSYEDKLELKYSNVVNLNSNPYEDGEGIKVAKIDTFGGILLNKLK